MSALPILTILKDGETVRSQAIDQDVVIGRGEGCVIRLDDRAVSRNHAVVKRTGEGIQIEKNSEFAPLKVNGAECTRAIVKEGDLIEIGPYLMKLSAGKSSAPAASAAAPVVSAPAFTAPAPMATPAFAPESPLDSPQEAGGQVLAMPIEPVESTQAVETSEGALEPLSLEGFENAVPDSASGNPLEISSDSFGSGSDDADAGGMSMDFADSSPPAVDEDAKTRIQKRAVDAKLVFASGAANVDTLDLGKDEISIGRGKQCDVVITDKKASRKNSVIAKVGNRYVLRDLDSANGTYVNGKQVKGEHELSHEDQIRIGEAEFQFLAENAEYQKQEAGGFLSVVNDEPPAASDAFEADGMGSSIASPLAPDAGEADSLGLGAFAADLGAEGAEVAEEPAKTGISLYYDRYIRNFKTLPITQKIIVLGVAFLVFSYLMESPPPPKPAAAPKAAVAAAKKTGTPYDQLSEDQKKKLDQSYSLAFDYFTKKDYDNTLNELRTALLILPSYEKAQELERFAREGQRRLQTMEEERRKKEEEAALKARIAEMVETTRGLMAKKKYDEAQPMFGEVLALDPDNSEIEGWKAEIEAYNEEKARKDQEKMVQDEINKRAWDTLNEALDLQKKGRYHEAIRVFAEVPNLGASDARPVKKAEKGLAESQRSIASARDPLLAEGQRLESEGDMFGAFKNYQSATRADPPHPAGYAGMDRVKSVMTERAKALYTEAVIAESYSDFATAYSRYNAILKSAPEGSLYYDRAKRKLGAYFNYKPEGDGAENGS